MAHNLFKRKAKKLKIEHKVIFTGHIENKLPIITKANLYISMPKTGYQPLYLKQ
jgi:hypothetical protein